MDYSLNDNIQTRAKVYIVENRCQLSKVYAKKVSFRFKEIWKISIHTSIHPFLSIHPAIHPIFWFLHHSSHQMQQGCCSNSCCCCCFFWCCCCLARLEKQVTLKGRWNQHWHRQNNAKEMIAFYFFMSTSESELALALAKLVSIGKIWTLPHLLR